jgi:hypothetical protein
MEKSNSLVKIEAIRYIKSSGKERDMLPGIFPCSIELPSIPSNMNSQKREV